MDCVSVRDPCLLICASSYGSRFQSSKRTIGITRILECFLRAFRTSNINPSAAHRLGACLCARFHSMKAGWGGVRFLRSNRGQRTESVKGFPVSSDGILKKQTAKEACQSRSGSEACEGRTVQCALFPDHNIVDGQPAESVH